MTQFLLSKALTALARYLLRGFNDRWSCTTGLVPVPPSLRTTANPTHSALYLHEAPIQRQTNVSWELMEEEKTSLAPKSQDSPITFLLHFQISAGQCRKADARHFPLFCYSHNPSHQPPHYVTPSSTSFLISTNNSTSNVAAANFPTKLWKRAMAATYECGPFRHLLHPFRGSRDAEWLRRTP